MKPNVYSLRFLGFIFLSVLLMSSNGFSKDKNLSYPAYGLFFGFEGDYHKMSIGKAFEHIGTFWYEENDIEEKIGFSIILGTTLSDEPGMVALAYQRHVMEVPDLKEKIPFSAYKIGGEYYLDTDSSVQLYVKVYFGYAVMKIEDYWKKTYAPHLGYEEKINGLAVDWGGGLRFWILNNLSINLGITIQWLYFKTLGSDGLDQFCLIPSLGLSYILKRK